MPVTALRETAAMDTVAALEHLLRPEQAAAFERDGFLMIQDAIAPDLLAGIREVVARADAEFRREPGIGPHHVLNLHDLVGQDPLWLELLDNPRTLPKVWGVLGWNIKLFHTQCIVTPPAPPGAGRGGYGWHQDNNRMNIDLETPREHHPRISVKVGYFLTDLPETGMGNLCVAPGSHRAEFREPALGEQPDGAIEVTAAAGDALLFDRRLWHSASTNCSTSTREFLTYGYAHRWIQPKSAMRLEHIYDAVDPIRRQLLGFCTTANGYYDPQPEDVPLRDWIRTHVGDAALHR